MDSFISPPISTKKPMTNSLFHCIIEPICQYGSHDEGCCQTYLYGRSSPEVWIRLWQQSESCGPPATIYSDFLLRTSQHPWLKTGKVRGDTKTTTCTSYEHLKTGCLNSMLKPTWMNATQEAQSHGASA